MTINAQKDAKESSSQVAIGKINAIGSSLSLQKLSALLKSQQGDARIPLRFTAEKAPNESRNLCS